MSKGIFYLIPVTRSAELIAIHNDISLLRACMVALRGVDSGITYCVCVRLDVAPTDIIECNVPHYETAFKREILQPLA